MHAGAPARGKHTRTSTHSMKKKIVYWYSVIITVSKVLRETFVSPPFSPPTRQASHGTLNLAQEGS